MTGDARRLGALLGLLAAVSFGISAPLAKLLLADVTPQLLAGLPTVDRRPLVGQPMRRVSGERDVGGVKVADGMRGRVGAGRFLISALRHHRAARANGSASRPTAPRAGHGAQQPAPAASGTVMRRLPQLGMAMIASRAATSTGGPPSSRRPRMGPAATAYVWPREFERARG